MFFTTVAAQRRLGGYDHGNGYDHDCCGSTTAAITTLAMVTIAAAMATIAARPWTGEVYNKQITNNFSGCTPNLTDTPLHGDRS